MSTSLENLVAQMSVAELAQRCGKSVSQLVELAFGTNRTPLALPTARRRGRPPGSKGKAKAATTAKGKAKAATPAATSAKPAAAAAKKDVNTRAAAGRGKFDETVLAAIRGTKGRMKASDLRTKVGGTPVQLRAALHRLIEDGKIKTQGKARGTSYSAA